MDGEIDVELGDCAHARQRRKYECNCRQCGSGAVGAVWDMGQVGDKRWARTSTVHGTIQDFIGTVFMVVAVG